MGRLRWFHSCIKVLNSFSARNSFSLLLGLLAWDHCCKVIVIKVFANVKILQVSPPALTRSSMTAALSRILTSPSLSSWGGEPCTTSTTWSCLASWYPPWRCSTSLCPQTQGRSCLLVSWKTVKCYFGKSKPQRDLDMFIKSKKTSSQIWALPTFNIPINLSHLYRIFPERNVFNISPRKNIYFHPSEKVFYISW